MDEPAAALNKQESQMLHDTIRSVVARGASVLIVTHFLKEVLALADTVTVLRDGRLVHTGPAAAETEATLVRAMLGRELSTVFPSKRPPAKGAGVVLSARDVVASGVDGASIEVHAGEIVGLAGLDGSGRAELAQAIYGAVPMVSGVVTVSGYAVGRATPRAAIKRGLSMVPASRRDDGLILGRSVEHNATISSLRTLSRAGVVCRREEKRRVRQVLDSLEVPLRKGAVSTLSGGNQQKVLFARALLKTTDVLIAIEPTRGVDVGAKAAIYRLLSALAERGTAILLVSSENQELIGLSHRVLVMCRGQVVAELIGEAMCEERILTAALTGNDPNQERS